MNRFGKWTVLVLVVVMLVSMAPPLDAKGGLRYTITVSKFENQAGWHGQWDIGWAWGTVMTDLLNKSGKFIVLGETDMRNEALAEQDLGASGRTAGGSKTPQMGNLTPAQLLVKGAITHVEDKTAGGGGGIRVRGLRLGGKKASSEVNATIYVVDSTTGQVMASTNVIGKSTDKGAKIGYSGAGWGGDIGGFKNDNTGKAIEAAVGEAIEFLLAQLENIPWMGSVVMVRDGKVYMNRGSREGVSSGQQFIIGTREVIRDPDSGEVLDESVSELARIRVDQVKEKLSICSVVSGSAGAIKKGMGVSPAS